MDVFFEIRKIKIFIMLPLHIRTSSRGARRGGEGREGRGDRWGEEQVRVVEGFEGAEVIL